MARLGGTPRMLPDQLHQVANLRRLNVRRRLPGSASASSSPATPRRQRRGLVLGDNPDTRPRLTSEATWPSE